MPPTSSPTAPVRPAAGRPGLTGTYVRAARLFAFGYPVLALGALLLPLPFPGREPFWVAGGAVGLVLGGYLARGGRRPRWLLVGGGWLLLALALVLTFVVGDPLGLLGLLFAVSILALVTGKVTPRTKRALVTTHVVFSGCWLGVAAVMVTLTVLGLRSDDPALVRVSYDLLELFDLTILPWSSVGAILTGIAVSLTSHWGLVRHWWILAKLVIAVAVISSTIGFIHGWAATAADHSAQLAAGSDLPAVGVQLVIAFGSAVFCVAVATVLSVYKPWGKTPWGRRAGNRTARA